VNPAGVGTKAGVWYRAAIPCGASLELRLRLTRGELAAPFQDFDSCMALRHTEADQFFAELQRNISSDDEKMVQRQALAGLIWSKQFYHFEVARWLKGDPSQPTPPIERLHGRNIDWRNLNNADIISMPDKWEYPWYASWDLAFHCIPFALIDPEFAKHQLVLLTREWYMHPNGKSRPTNGRSATSIRRCTRGLRGACIRWIASKTPAKAIWNFWSACSTS